MVYAVRGDADSGIGHSDCQIPAFLAIASQSSSMDV